MIHHLRYLVTFALSHEETPEADPGDGGQRDLVQEATSYRPDKNGFSKKENTKYTGPADNIYTF